MTRWTLLFCAAATLAGCDSVRGPLLADGTADAAGIAGAGIAGAGRSVTSATPCSRICSTLCNSAAILA